MDAGEYLTTIASLSNSECEAEKVKTFAQKIQFSISIVFSTGYGANSFDSIFISRS